MDFEAKYDDGGWDDDVTGTLNEDDWDDSVPSGKLSPSSSTKNQRLRPPSPLALNRSTSYEVMDRAGLGRKQESFILNVMEQIDVTREESAVLLRLYNWNTSKLLDDWLKDSDDVRRRMGVHPIPTQNNLSSQKFTCPLCFDSMPFNETIALGCNHRFCNSCWSSWLEAETDKGPSSVFTRCCAYKCTEIIPEKVAMQLLKPAKQELYSKWLFDALVHHSTSIKWCPKPGCSFAVEYKLGGAREVTCQCSHVFCFKCSMEGHRPADCDTVAAWILKNSTDSENVNWIIANTKKCPKCSVQIEKNHGCNHMSCRNCRHEFCWLCKGEWSSHGTATGGFYKCNKFETSSKDSAMVKEEQDAETAKNALQKYMHYFTRYDNHDKSIRFAEETRAKAEQVMGKLQDKLGTNYQDVQFVLNAVNAVITCRRVLKWSYCFGYYLEGKTEKDIFENHQMQLEKFTEELHGLSEKPIEDLLETKVRTQIINYTRVVDKYRVNVLDAIENGLHM